jgi:hypothetical protein
VWAACRRLLSLLSVWTSINRTSRWSTGSGASWHHKGRDCRLAKRPPMSPAFRGADRETNPASSPVGGCG